MKKFKPDPKRKTIVDTAGGLTDRIMELEDALTRIDEAMNSGRIVINGDVNIYNLTHGDIKLER